jgi:hypothetical protein
MEKIKKDNLHLGPYMSTIHLLDNQIPYYSLRSICSGLNEIASLPPMTPTTKIKTQYPGIYSDSRDVYVKVVPGNILYLVQDNCKDKNELIVPIRWNGYILKFSNNKKLLPVSKLDKLAEMMEISYGNDLIE